jgi:hypothetical protein
MPSRLDIYRVNPACQSGISPASAAQRVALHGSRDCQRTLCLPRQAGMSQELRRQEPLPASTARTAFPEVALFDADREALRQAVIALEGPSYVARLSALAGQPIELLGQPPA